MNNWLFFALLAPTLWASTNVIDAAIRRHYVKDEVLFTWVVSLSRIPLVLVFLALGGFQFPEVSYAGWMILGGILWLFPIVLYFRAIEFEEPSRVALFLQLVPVFALLISFFILNETLTGNQWMAFLLLILGGTIAALKKLEGVWHVSRALKIIALASLFWAVSDVLFKLAEEGFPNFWMAFSFYLIGSSGPVLFYLLKPTGRKKLFSQLQGLPGRAWAMIVYTELAGTGGVLAFAYALTLGKVALTSVLMGIQPLLALVFGLVMGRFIKEIPKESLTKNALAMKAFSLVLILLGLFALNL